METIQRGIVMELLDTDKATITVYMWLRSFGHYSQAKKLKETLLAERKDYHDMNDNKFQMLVAKFEQAERES